MNVTYSEKARRWDEGYPLLEQITKRLEEVTGPYSSEVQAEWDRTEEDEERAVCTLRHSGWGVSTSDSFTLEDLASFTHMQVLLYRLWGSLLGAYSHNLLQKLREDGE